MNQTKTESKLTLKQSSNTIVIYHASCYDGFCAAWLLYQIYPNAQFLPFQHGMEAPSDEWVSDCDVIIADFSFPREEMIRLIESSRSLICLDHHKSAKEAIADLPGCKFCMNRSGARMVWDHFRDQLKIRFPEKTHWLVDYTEDRDLWRWELDKSREINAALRLIPFDFEVWDNLEKFGTRIAAFDREIDGETVVDYLSVQRDRLVHKAQAIDIKFPGNHFIAWSVNVTDTNVISDVGAELATLSGVGVTYFHDGEEFVYSIRSAGETDVSAIAKAFGGGGHHNAAGFRCKSFPPVIS